MLTTRRFGAFMARNERAVAAASFVAGFVFDLLLVGRIDSLHLIAQQVVYLTLITLVLLQMLREEGGPPPEAERMPRLKRLYFEYRSVLVHFLLGTLLNMYAIFFFKSSSLLVSFGFMGFLVVVLLANESARLKFLGLSLKFALLGLCFLCFAAAVVPIFAGATGLPVFLASMLAGCLPLVAAGAWIRLSAPESFPRVRRQMLVPLGAVLTGFLAFYLFRLVPPVPLSIPFIGIYHAVERTGEGYRLSHERPSWRWWHNGDQSFRAQPGDKVYVFFRIFSPTRFSDEVVVRWYWKGEQAARGWVLQDSLSIKITGGREQGFRGYGVKANYQPGAWKVQVETTDGREIGRIYFDLEGVPEAPRSFEAELAYYRQPLLLA